MAALVTLLLENDTSVWTPTLGIHWIALLYGVINFFFFYPRMIYVVIVRVYNIFWGLNIIISLAFCCVDSLTWYITNIGASIISLRFWLMIELIS